MTIRTTFLALFLISILSALLQAQTPSADGDSLVRRSPALFDSTAVPKDRPLRPDSASPGGLWSYWRPKFTVGFERKDLMGLQDDYAMLKYNRADGPYLGLGTDFAVKAFLENRLQGYFGFGYGFGSHYWQVFGGLKRDFLSAEQPLRFGVEGHVITDTKDAWKMGVTENTAYALLAGIDARDYFQRNGFSVGLQQFINSRTSVKAEYRFDNYINSRREAGWSLFGPHQPFFEVPPIREGKINSVVVNVLTDYMTDRTWTQPHAGAEVQAEFGLGATAFAQYVLDLRLKQSFFQSVLGFAVHARFATVTGDAPPQKRFTIGGFGTLEGYPQNAYEGNRMTLFQTDLLFRPIPRLPLAIIMSNDFGMVSTADSAAPALTGLMGEARQFLYSPGIYIGTPTGKFRLGAVWRTDTYAVPRFVVRFSERF